MAIDNILITDWFKYNYYSINWATPKAVNVAVYSRTPSFEDSTQASFAQISALSELDSRPEWVKVSSTVTSKVGGVSTTFYLKRLQPEPSLDTLQLVFDNSGTYTPASLEDDAGWEFTPTSPATSVQEEVNTVVFYLTGTYSGVTNPVIFATRQGVGVSTIVHSGALFGQTKTSVTAGTEHILALSTSSVSAVNISTRSKTSNVVTITTAVNHGLSVGNTVEITGTGDATGFDGFFLVTTVPTSTSFTYVKTGADVAQTSSTGTAQFKENAFRNAYMLLLPAPPEWESSHTHHIWLEPQRVNFIANPSFERNDVLNWRVRGADGSALTLSRVTGGVGGSARPYCGSVTGTNTTKIIESNYFPLVTRWISFSFFLSAEASGSNPCSIKYGIVSFDNTYTTVSYFYEETELSNGTSTSGFREIRGLVPAPQNAREMCLRIEVAGCTQFWIDNVLVDCHEGQYSYFDGDSTEGLSGDFRWMGGTDYQNKHFSVWYNNYQNTRYRLMGDYDTNDDLYKPGLVEEWAPTGANLVAHWDAITSFTPLNWSGDAFYPIKAVDGTPVSVIDDEYDFQLNLRP